jgi:hypothetical protein
MSGGPLIDGHRPHASQAADVVGAPAYDPNVWSGRASQEVSWIWRLCGLASMYPASDWSAVVLRAIMDISARAFSLPDRPQAGPFGSPGFACAGKTGPPSHFILSQTSAGNGTMSSLSPDQCSSFVRAMRPFLRPGLRVFRASRAGGRQGWPSRLALHHVGVSRPRLDGPEHGATLTQVGAPSRSSWHIRSYVPC